jgi:hypothetical protein
MEILDEHGAVKCDKCGKDIRRKEVLLTCSDKDCKENYHEKCK